MFLANGALLGAKIRGATATTLQALTQTILNDINHCKSRIIILLSHLRATVLREST